MNKSCIYQLLWCLSFVLLSSACSDDEEVIRQAEKPVPLYISPVMESTPFQKSEYYQTHNSVTLGIFLSDRGEVPQPNTSDAFNVPYAYSGAQWKAVSGERTYYQDGDLETECDLVAYCPQQPDLVSPEECPFNVATDQSTEELFHANDFLYAKAQVLKKKGQSVALNMEHLFAQVTVKVNYEEKPSSPVVLTFKNVNTQSSVNLVTKAVNTDIGDKGEIKPLVWRAASSYINRNYSAVMPPHASGEMPVVSIEFDGEEKEIPLSGSLESGMAYSLPVSISAEGNITVGDMIANAWDRKVLVCNEYHSTGSVITFQKMRDENPVTLVIFGDGFTHKDLKVDGVFEKKATEAIEFMFNTEPFKTYRDYFNVYIIPVESKESGISYESSPKDTYFKCLDRSGGTLVADKFKVYEALNAFCPDIVEGKTDDKKAVVAILTNHNTFGGNSYPDQKGGGYCISAIADRPDMKDFKNVFLHEFGGHTFGRLGDEYSQYGNDNYTAGYIPGHYFPVPAEQNLACNQYQCIPEWRRMMNEDKDKFPKVGMFEGGGLYQRGIYRSEASSCMVSNLPYFNAVSRFLIAKRIMTIAKEPFNYQLWLSKDVD